MDYIPLFPTKPVKDSQQIATNFFLGGALKQSRVPPKCLDQDAQIHFHCALGIG